MGCNCNNIGCGTMTKFELNANIVSKINEVLNKYDNDQTKLVGILLDIQDIIPKNYIPVEVATYVAEKLNLPIIKVYDVITFYAALSDKPRADYVIQVCNSVVCKFNGYDELRASLEKVLGIKVGEVTPDGKFSLDTCACFGACDISPAIRINSDVYGNLTEEKLKEVINSYR